MSESTTRQSDSPVQSTPLGPAPGAPGASACTRHAPGRRMQPARVATGQIAKFYDRIAPMYDGWAWLTERKARKLAVERAAVQDGESVLEVAVGTGLMFRDLLRKNPTGKTVGVDLTEGMLARAKTKAQAFPAEQWALSVGDARKLPYADATFDLIVNNYMFDLLPETDFGPVLAEFQRVLKPGGRMVLVNMATASPLNLWELVYRVRPSLLGGCRGVQLEPFVRASGFERVERETLSQLGFHSELVTARRPA